MTLTDYPITVEQVKLLIREGEGLIVEFKERYTPRIDEDIVAFANAKGGTLLLGVRDQGIVVGERLTNDLKAKINSLTRNCKPSITTELSQVGEALLLRFRLLPTARWHHPEDEPRRVAHHVRGERAAPV